jgi:hypothetical protein
MMTARALRPLSTFPSMKDMETAQEYGPAPRRSPRFKEIRKKNLAWDFLKI